MTDMESLRERASELMDAGRVGFRSCPNCNGAHAHIADADDFVIACFACGAYWLSGVDITIYEDES